MRTQHEVRLLRRPRGLPGPGDFEVVEAPFPVPDASDVLIRNFYFRLEASIRMMVAEGAEDVKGVPFPAVPVGETPGAETIGQVMQAPPGCALAPGDLVLHHAGWRQYACLPVSACQPVPGDLPEPADHLSHGWTAYAALTQGARVAKGGVIFVSSAAGAIGSMAGQIGRLLGAKQVIGGTSTQAKARWLESELGFSAGVARDAGPLAPQVAAIAPDGVDLWIDLVGGEQVAAAIACVRPHGVILVMGALAGQLAASGAGRTAPAQIDSFPLLLKQLTLRGYSADEHPEARAAWTRQFDTWLRAGQIRFPHTVIDGLADAIAALPTLSAGGYRGTVLVKV
jgi:NADPH-dependent curcumin reductase CurA